MTGWRMMQMFFATGVMLTALSMSQVQAGLILSFENLTIAEGGTGSMDVFLHATSPLDTLNLFVLEFAIAPESAVGTLGFALTPQNSHLTDSQYVFANTIGGSTAVDSGDFANVGFDQQTYTGVDSTIDPFEDVNGPFTRLLARIDLTTLGLSGPAAQANDIFRVTFLLDASFFTNSAGEEITPTFAEGVDYGTVSIAALATVPEPSSLLLGAVAIVVTRCRLRTRRRGHNG